MIDLNHWISENIENSFTHTVYPTSSKQFKCDLNNCSHNISHNLTHHHNSCTNEHQSTNDNECLWQPTDGADVERERGGHATRRLNPVGNVDFAPRLPHGALQQRDGERLHDGSGGRRVLDTGAQYIRLFVYVIQWSDQPLLRMFSLNPWVTKVMINM